MAKGILSAVEGTTTFSKHVVVAHHGQLVRPDVQDLI